MKNNLIGEAYGTIHGEQELMLREIPVMDQCIGIYGQMDQKKA
jgi:hypothetical protein